MSTYWVLRGLCDKMCLKCLAGLKIHVMLLKHDCPCYFNKNKKSTEKTNTCTESTEVSSSMLDALYIISFNPHNSHSR